MEVCCPWQTGGGSDDEYIIELSYRFNYVEEVKRRDPWTFRHTAVYHKHRADTDIILILHPSPTTKSRLDSRILGLEAADQRNQPLIRSILQNPYHLHSLVLSSYLENWRWYMKYKGEQFSTEVRIVINSVPER